MFATTKADSITLEQEILCSNYTTTPFGGVRSAFRSRDDVRCGYDTATVLLEAPGFMLLNYGRNTPILTVAAHLAYGAIVGAFVGASGR